MKARHHLAIGILCLAGTVTTAGFGQTNFDGKILVDGRLRYELANITGLEQSNALTYRLRFGFETTMNDWATFLLEGEGTMDTGIGDYDAYPGGQGDAGHAIVADPQNLELNRMQVGFNLDPVQAIVGRQRIIRNNARFVGNVGWRQNEQTYDAISMAYSPTSELSLYYAYLDGANRIFGTRANVETQRRFDMESHILEGQFDVGNGIKLGAYGYLLGIENAAANSSDTIGIWATGSSNLSEDGLSINWRTEFAEQSDNSHSPSGSDFDLGYYHLTGGVTQKGTGGLTLGYEVLEGDGSRGFSTPLATLHAFNGFADAFLSTPTTGLKDLYVKLAIPVAEGITAALFYHDFEADQGGASFGKEYDAVCSWKINGNLSVTGKVAYFDGTTRPNIARVWLQLDMKY